MVQFVLNNGVLFVLFFFGGGHPVLPVQYYVVLAIVGHGKARFMSNFIRL